MLIMPTTTTDFQALADGIVDDFFRNDVALTDGIAKVAVDREFTPEEVTRLTEKTNTAASLYFLKTAEDKKGSFKLAELEDVLRRTHAGDEPGNGDTPAGQEKTAESGRNEASFAVYTAEGGAAIRLRRLFSQRAGKDGLGRRNKAGRQHGGHLLP